MRCCRWWPPCSPATATWPSAPVWPPVPTWSAAPGASSSPAATTSSCVPRSRSSCSDAQCGFKAMRREAAVELLPLVEDDEWFFDTEVLVTAQRLGLRIHEVPVDWVDDTDSRVEVLPDRLADLRGVWRMLGPASRERATPARPGRRRPAPPRPRPPDWPWCPDGPPEARPDRRTAGSTTAVGGLRRRTPALRRGRGGRARWPTPPCSRPSPPEWAATRPTPWPSWRAAWATPPPTAAWPASPASGSTGRAASVVGRRAGSA